MQTPQNRNSTTGSAGCCKSVCAALLALPFFAPVLTGQQIIPVGGSASYAEFPPAHENADAFLNRELYIHPSRSGEPVPTNDWWTDLIFSQFSGNMWAYPLTIQADAQGVDVFFPIEYNATGTGMVTEYPLEVRGFAEVVVGPSDTILADFEGGVWPAGWTASGTAFGSAPATGTLAGQSLVTGFNGIYVANSFHGGDGSTGTLSSPTFTVNADYIHALVGGGNHPGDAELRLVVGGAVVRTATGVNSENLAWASWDVSEYAGQTAQLELVDHVTGGWGHILADQIVMTDDANPAEKFSTDFSPQSAVALDWSDWHVQFRMQQNANAYYDVTMAHGIPFVWVEATGVRPLLNLDASAVFYDESGNVLSLPITASKVAVEVQGRTFGLHLPDGTTLEPMGGQTILSFAGADSFLVVSALPDKSDLVAFDTYAYAIPRETQMDWSYQQTGAHVRTNWAVTTEALKGTNLTTLQGWIPHHYRETSNDLIFTGDTYLTPRGKLKLAAGNTAQIDFPFTGILPNLPTPSQLGGAHDYDPDRMEDYLQNYATRTEYGGDTYWGGKSLTQFGDYMTIASDLDSNAKDVLQVSLLTALSDWFTYDGSETEHYFARYDRYKALVGFNESFGSAEFTDHHFHYGYFIRAAALLGLQDAQFLGDYGDMVTLVAKQFANWDRTDTDFPVFRTFDMWHGHSYAGGVSSPGGNNQESTSEAMQSWSGLFLLGQAMNNNEMTAAGAMGYAIERLAVKEYWNDYHGNPAATQPVLGDGGTLPPEYGHDMVGILFDGGPAFATFFNGDPAWMYGIQWLPIQPGMAYLGEDPAFSKAQMASMIADRVPTMGTAARGVISVYNLTPARTDWNRGDYTAALQKFAAAIKLANEHNPSYTTAETIANPLYIDGQLSFTVAPDGAITLDSSIWSESNLASYPDLLPPANGQALAGWPLYDYLYTNFSYDEAYLQDKWEFEVLNYQSGVDTEQAKKVIGAWGTGLGNVILSFMAHYDADLVAELMDEFYQDAHPIGVGNDISGLTYYTTHALRSLGHIVYDRHTDIPTSQVFYNDATGEYSYAVYNPEDTEQTATVYASGVAIGSFPVPARTLVQHKLDQVLTALDVVASNPSPTITNGSTVQFSVTGLDQYGATHPLSSVSWSVDAGGSIDANGLFTATTDADPVTLTVTADGLSQTYSFRVGDAPYLADISIEPDYVRVVEDGSYHFSAQGLDQYGDNYPLGNLIWAVDGGGTMGADGHFNSNGTLGSYYVTADENGFSQTAIVTVHAPLANIAQGKTAVSSSDLGANTAKKLIDGDASTRWESVHKSDLEWIYIDLGASYDIGRVFIDWEPAYASEYQIQFSDDAVNWTTVLTVLKSNFDDDNLSVSGTARYVRMLGVSRATDYGYSIFEMEVYGSPASSTITATSMLLNPPGVDLMLGSSTDFDAFVFDANHNGGPTDNVSWTATGGQIDSSGLYTPDEVGGPFIVTASYLGVAAGASLIVSATVHVLGGVLTNIAPLGTATASSEENVALIAANAIDGDLNTRWSSAFSDDEAITIDLGEVETVESVTLHWEGAYASAYEIQLSNDGTNWSTAVAVTGGNGGEDNLVIAADARFVRMQGLTRATPYGYSLWEFEIFSFTEGTTPPPPAGVNLAAGQPATASSVEAAFAAANAFDADGGTRWSSAFVDSEWIQVDLGSIQAISQVILNWEGAYGADYIIQVSDDATTWTDALVVTGGDGGIDDLAVAATGRYVRMQGVSRGTPWGYSLWEFEVY